MSFHNKKTKRDQPSVYICDNPRWVISIWGVSRKSSLVLNKDDVERNLHFQDCIDDEIVLSNVLRKNLDIFQNHACALLMAE